MPEKTPTDTAGSEKLSVTATHNDNSEISSQDSTDSLEPKSSIQDSSSAFAAELYATDVSSSDTSHLMLHEEVYSSNHQPEHQNNDKTEETITFQNLTFGDKPISESFDSESVDYKGPSVNEKNGQMLLLVRNNGDRVEFKHDLDSHSGLPSTLSEITTTRGNNQEIWKTEDGFNWKQYSEDGKEMGQTWQGIKKLDSTTGEISETSIIRADSDIDAVTTITDKDGKILADTRQTDLDGVLNRIEEVTDTDNWFSLRKETDTLNRDLRQLSAQEINLVKRLYNPEDPNSLERDIEDKFEQFSISSGGLNGSKWAIARGHLNRTGEPGELEAIELFGDTCKSRESGNIKATRSNTRRILLACGDNHFNDIESSLSRLYGVNSIQQLYKENGGNRLHSYMINSRHRGKIEQVSCSYTKEVLENACTSGYQSRPVEAQLNIVNSALDQGSIEMFRESAGVNALTPEARNAFLESDQFDSLDNVFSGLELQEAQDISRYGKLSARTAFDKSVGVMNNVTDALENSLLGASPEEVERYLNGKHFVENEIAPQSEEGKLAVEDYQGWQESFKRAAALFGTNVFLDVPRRVARYEDLLINSSGEETAASGSLFTMGSEFWRAEWEQINYVHNLDQNSIDTMLEGIKVDGHTPSGDGYTRMSNAFDVNSSDSNSDKARDILKQKALYGFEINAFADNLIDSSEESDSNSKAVREIRKIPAFRTLSSQDISDTASNYLLERQLSNGQKSFSALPESEQQDYINYINSERGTPIGQLRSFLKGREQLRKLENITSGELRTQYLRGKELDESGVKPKSEKDFEALKYYNDNNAALKPLENLPASFIARQERDYLDTLDQTEIEDRELYKSTRYEAIQTHERQRLSPAIDDNTIAIGNDNEKAILDAIENAVPKDRILYNTLTSFKEGIDSKLDKHLGGSDRIAARLMLDSYANDGKLNDVDQLTVNLAKANAEKSQSPTDVMRMIKQAIRDAENNQENGAEVENKPFSKRLLENDDFMKSVRSILGRYKTSITIEPLINNGIEPVHVLKQMHGQNSSKVFLDGIMDATQEGFEYLGSEKGRFDKRDLLIWATPEMKNLADIVINQGKVEPEDRLRAFTTGANSSEDEAFDLLENLEPGKRLEVVRKYQDKYDSSLREDLFKKVSRSRRFDIDRLAEENHLEADQALTRTRGHVAASTQTFLGDFASNYDARISEYLTNFEVSYRENGGELNTKDIENRLNEVSGALKSFEGTKDELAELLAEGAILAVSLAAAPFSGGTSLTMLARLGRLATISVAGGLSGTFLKANLTGNYDNFSTDLIKFTALTAAGFAGGEAIAGVTGLGSKLAKTTFSSAMKSPALKSIPGEVQEELAKRFTRLVNNGMVNGGVKDKSIKSFVSGIKNLTKEQQDELAEALIKNLGSEAKRITGWTAKDLGKRISRGGRSALYEGGAAYVADSGAEAIRQQMMYGKLDATGISIAGLSSLFAAAGLKTTFNSVGMGYDGIKSSIKRRQENVELAKVEAALIREIDEISGNSADYEIPPKMLAELEKARKEAFDSANRDTLEEGFKPIKNSDWSNDPVVIEEQKRLDLEKQSENMSEKGTHGIDPDLTEEQIRLEIKQQVDNMSAEELAQFEADLLKKAKEWIGLTDSGPKLKNNPAVIDEQLRFDREKIDMMSDEELEAELTRDLEEFDRRFPNHSGEFEFPPERLAELEKAREEAFDNATRDALENGSKPIKSSDWSNDPAIIEEQKRLDLEKQSDNTKKEGSILKRNPAWHNISDVSLEEMHLEMKQQVDNMSAEELAQFEADLLRKAKEWLGVTDSGPKWQNDPAVRDEQLRLEQEKLDMMSDEELEAELIKDLEEFDRKFPNHSGEFEFPPERLAELERAREEAFEQMIKNQNTTEDNP